MRIRSVVAATGAILAGFLMAVVMAQPATAMPMCDVEDPPPTCDTDPVPPPPPPAYPPVLSIDGAQQNTTRNAIRVWGSATDSDAPGTALTVKFSLDGVAAGSMVANLNGGHGFDMLLATPSAAGYNVCVTAVNIGSGTDATKCQASDNVVAFQAYNITYDMSQVGISPRKDQLDSLTVWNETSTSQSATMNGSRSIVESESWSPTMATAGLTISLATIFKTQIPIVVDDRVVLTTLSSCSYTNFGSCPFTQNFAWSQGINAPAMTYVEATVSVTHSIVRAPYAVNGEFTYASGARVTGSICGNFAGGSNDRLTVTLYQYDL